MEPVLIATDSAFADKCAIQDFTLDMVIGHDNQDFTACFEPVDGVGGGSLLYIDGSEFGGIVDDVTTNTESGLAEYHGRTWCGILAAKIIMPPSDSDYRTVTGEANSVLSQLVALLDLGDVFEASSEDSGITVNYQFARFVDGYSGIFKMLASVGAKLCVRRVDGMTVLKAVNARTIEDEADSDLMDFELTKTVRTVNHLVCAGEGEGTERVILNLYADENGNVSQTQSLFGVDEVTDFYDYNNADAAQLLEDGTEKLAEYQTNGSIDVISIGRGSWDIGDTLIARNNKSGITVSAPIIGKTITLNQSTNWALNVEYEIGEPSKTASSFSKSAELPEKVNRDGDTMTGDLTIYGKRLIVKSSNIDRDTAPASNTTGNSYLRFLDKDGDYIGSVYSRLTADKSIETCLQARTNVNGTEQTSTISIGMDDDGTRYYYVTDPSAFCEALHVGDYVNKNQTASVSTTNNAYTNICSISLNAGIWIVFGNVRYASNATGRRALTISSTSQGSNEAMFTSTPAINGSYTRLNVSGVVISTATTTYYLIGWQNSGAALNAIGYIRAVRIK